MSASLLEIVDLGDGEIVLQRADDDSEPLVVIRFSEEATFRSGDAAIKPEMIPIIERVVNVLSMPGLGLFDRLRFGAAGGHWFTDDELAHLTCPVLLTGSLHDSMMPDLAEKQTALAARIPQAELLLVNAGDHPLAWSLPAVFYRTVLPFLAAV